MTTTPAVAEAPIWLDVNGTRARCWTGTPEHLEALAAGWLLAEGYLRPGDPAPALERVEGPGGSAGIRARVPAERAAEAAAERRHRTEHGCGLLHFVDCAPGRLGDLARTLPLPPSDAFPDLFRELYARAERSSDIGGLHAAALTDGGTLVCHVEEVGRHNAVDKVIGRALLDGHDPGGLGLVLSARISGEIALKAARAGLAWVASRSVPTTLAVRIADAAGLPLLARAAGKRSHLHRPGAAEVAG